MASSGGQTNISYKDRQEQFVSGYNGTTVLEIALIVSSAPAGVFLRNTSVNAMLQSSIKCPIVIKFILDYSLLVLPVLGCFTFLADSIIQILSAMVVAALTIIIVISSSNRLSARDDLHGLNDLAMAGKRPFITDFRAFVNIATAICILAVDFDLFPRRFAKAETYGTGLMDVGVGAFVISNAIVCPEARGKCSYQRSFRLKLVGVLKTFKSTLPFWVLGMCRCLAVKSIDYQEHVSEYGVHWNFFFTLAVVKVMTSIVLTLFPPSMSWLLSIVIGAGYQYLLTGLKYRDYVLHGSDGLGSRKDIFEANREGIFSCIGYCSIYFAGVQLGTFLLKPRHKLKEWVNCFWLLVITDCIFWVALSASESHVELVSRRLANFSFILWMMSYNLQLIASFLLVDIIGTTTTYLINTPENYSGYQSCLLEATNYNGLFYFLFANVLTGLVNLLVSTLTTPPAYSFVILNVYLGILSAVVSVLYGKNVHLKFW